MALVASNGGKHRGWIWARLLEVVATEQHFGANPHADDAVIKHPWGSPTLAN